jgi:hypothetical protein
LALKGTASNAVRGEGHESGIIFVFQGNPIATFSWGSHLTK